MILGSVKNGSRKREMENWKQENPEFEKLFFPLYKNKSPEKNSGL
jgi:hypothetical protein